MKAWDERHEAGEKREDGSERGKKKPEKATRNNKGKFKPELSPLGQIGQVLIGRGDGWRWWW